MNYSYYVGEGPEATALIAEARAAFAVFTGAVQELTGLFPNSCGGIHQGSKGALIGIAISVDSPLDNEQCRELGLRLRRKDPLVGGSLAYYPNIRSNKGKELNCRIADINKLHTTVSAHITGQLKADRWLFYAACLYRTAAGVKDGKIFVRVPGLPGDEESEKFPTLPGWFRAPATVDELAFIHA